MTDFEIKNNPHLNIMAIIPNSFVNGPTETGRYVIWTQYCPHHCPGCFNPQSWNKATKSLWLPEDLAQAALDSDQDGITLSGGEPLAQPVNMLKFLLALHDESGKLKGFPKGIICFTGYTIKEIQEMEGEEGVAARECLQYIDLIIDGRFIEALKYPHKLAGSSNQTFTFLNKPGRGKELIREDEVHTDHEVEVHITENNEIQVTGFPNVDKKFLAKYGLKIIQ